MEQDEYIVRRGLAKKHASIDYSVWKWKKTLEESRCNPVTKKEIQSFAFEMYKKAGIENFKASDGWYRRWRMRWKCSNVVRTKQTANKPEQDTESSPTVKNSLKSVKLSKKASPMKFIAMERKPCAQVTELNNKIDHSICKVTTGMKPKTYTPKKCGFDFPNILGLIRVKPSTSGQHNLLEPVSVKKIPENLDTVSDNHGVVESQSNLEANNFGKIKMSLKSQRIMDSKANTEFVEHKGPSTLSSAISLLNMSTCSEQTKTCPVNEPVKINAIGSKSNPDWEQIVETSSKINIKKSRCKEQSPGIYLNDNIIVSSSKTEQHNTTKDTILIENETKLIQMGSVESYTVNNSSPTLNSTNFNSYSSNAPTSTKNIFDHNYLDFGDHELFCESCDDFHPHGKGSHSFTCKQNKNIADSLLNSVLDSNDTAIVANQIVINKQLKCKMDIALGGKGKVSSAEELKNTSLMLSKGKRYQVQFKTKVVNYALNHNAKQAAHMFKVNRGTVSEWLSERKRQMGCNYPNPCIDEDNLENGDSEFLSWLESSKFNLTNDLIKQKTTEWLSTEDNFLKNCLWLHMYANRLHGVKDSMTKKRYITYPDTFKRVVVFYAETHSKIAAARVFSVARRRVLEWQVLAGSKKKKLAENKTASNVTDESVDKNVWEWYCNQKSYPTSKQVRAKALEMYRSAGYLSIACGAQWYYRWRARHQLPPPRAQQLSDSQLLAWVLTQLDNNRNITHTLLAEQAAIIFNTKVSRGWTFRFCKKYHKLLLTLPDPSTPLFSAMELQVCNYRKLVQDAMATYGSTKINVVAMDEVPIQFPPKDNGKRPLLLRKPGFESCLASLVVSSFSDGTLLPTMFIFKGNLPIATKFDSNVVATATETGKASEGIIIQWINQILVKQLGEAGGILITDCFGVHTTKAVQTLLGAHNIQHLVIPGGCAFKLLPVNQICQSFQAMLEELCYSSINQQTETLRPPSPEQLYTWSLHVHKLLSQKQSENTKAAFIEMLFKST